ncbi:hypothetical protein [Actinospica robiniae]|uniref:hypothetical protein n=1 Tax=Actinospica robiniae TaxID=304901 RepID=UPI0012FCCDD3|nr:hypothetical protein [Actinospica robiniae]
MVLAPAQGWAGTAWPTVGTLKSSISAPSTAHAGSTYSFSDTISQTSSDTMLVDGTLLTVWLPSDNSAYVASNNAVKWFNPATGSWQSPTSVENSTGQYEWDLGSLSNWLPLKPHASMTLKFQLSLRSSLPAGTYHVFFQDAWAYELVNAAGAPIDADLDTPDFQTTFVIGGSSSTSGKGGKPSSGTSATSKTSAKAPTPAKSTPTAAHSSPAASASASPSPSPSTSSPTPATSSSEASTPIPASSRFDPVLSASSRSDTARRVLWPLSFVLMAGASVAYIAFRRRRVRDKE